jgi:hypothetical protein
MDGSVVEMNYKGVCNISNTPQTTTIDAKIGPTTRCFT